MRRQLDRRRSANAHGESRLGRMALVRLLVVLAVIALIGLIGWPRLTAPTAGAIAIVGLSAYAAFALLLLYLRRRSDEQREEVLTAGVVTTLELALPARVVLSVIETVFGFRKEAVIRLMVRGALRGSRNLYEVASLPLLAIAFFALWTFAYLGLWALDPTACPADPATTESCGAFLGVAQRPLLSEFVYFSVNVAFVSLPPDFIAHSSAAHTVVTIEIVAGVALVTTYAAEFVRSAARESDDD
jgi:hypothetical protein